MDQHGFSLRGLLADTPAVVWSITAVWALLLVLWSVLPPIFFAPDEPQHIDSVVDAVGRSPLLWIAPHADFMGPALQEATQQYGFLEPPESLEALVGTDRRSGGRTSSEARPRDDRPSYRQLFNSDGLGFRRVNQMAQHPPLYYRLTAGALALLPGWRTAGFDAVVGFLRLLTVTTMLGLPILLADIARSIDGRRMVSVSAALSPFLVPQIAHLGSVVTNDSLLLMLAALLAALLARVHQGDMTRRTANWVGAVLLAALLTKAFALLLPLAVLTAYLGAARVSPDGLGQVWRPLSRAALIAMLSLFWYGENVLRFGGIQPAVASPLAPDVQGSLGDFLPRMLQVQAQTFWGRFGWAETGFTTTTSTVLSVLMVALVAVGIWRRDSLQVATLAMPGTVVVGLTMAQSFSYFGVDGGIRAIHGRYFFISIAGILVLAVIGLHRMLAGRLSRWSWVPLVLGAGWLQVTAWTTSILYFWTTPDAPSMREGLMTLLAWQPWPPRLVALTAVILAVVAADLLRRLLVESLAVAPSAPPQTDESEDRPDREQDHIASG